MANLATNVFPADGIKTFWDFEFAGVSPDSGSGTTPYLYAADVKALELYKDIEGNAQAAVRIVTIDPALPLRANIVGAPVAAGRQIKIYRSTEIRYPLVDYRDRQSVSEFDLDLANRQAIFVAQETVDAAATALALDKNDNYDVQDHRIVNLAPAVDGSDAVNLDQTTSLLSRSLRIPAGEAGIPDLGPAASRAGRLLTFDEAGLPLLRAPANDSATALALLLASDEGAGQIGTSSGATVQEAMDARAALLSSSAGAAVIGTEDGPLQDVLAGLRFPFVGSNLRYTVPVNGATMTGDAAWSRQYYVEDFGAVGDGVTNDAPAFQAAILAAATAGAGKVHTSAFKKYKLTTNILIPGYVDLDLGGADYYGNPAVGTAMFTTATLQGGILVGNLASVDETELVHFTKIHNAVIHDAWRIFDFKNFIIGSSLADIRAVNCVQVIKGSRCFYSSYSDMSAIGGNDPQIPTYHFTGQNNAMLFTRVSSTTDWGFAFTGGTTAVHFNTCTYEGGTRGFYFDNEVHGVLWSSLYSEAVQGTLFHLTDVTSFSGRLVGGYLNYIDIVVRDPSTGYMFGEFMDSSTELVNVGQVVGGFTYRGLIYMQGTNNASTSRIVDNFEGSTTWPANIITSTNAMAQVSRRSFRKDGSGVVTCAAQTTGVLPLRYSGNCGRVLTNTVAYCTHQPFTPGASSIIVLIDTKIVYDAYTPFTRFKLELQDANGIHTIFGDTYGNTIKRHDALLFTTAISDASGFLRLEIYGLNHPSGVYTCKGTIQLLN